MKTDGQLMLSLGALMAAEREKRGIAVERAAKETRMRPQRIRDMENDDLSHFSNPSYARMFLIAYAKYLGIPMRTINDHLPDRGESASEGYQYISTSTEDLPSLRHDIASRPTRNNGPLYALAIATLLVVLVAVAGGAYYLTINAQRITASVEKPAPTPVPAPPPPQVIVRETVVLANVAQDGSAPGVFSQKVEWATQDDSAPEQADSSRTFKPGLSATIAPEPGASPTPQSVISEDQAFLLGSSPELKPANVR